MTFAMTTARPGFFRAPFQRQTWFELAYALTALFRGVFGFVLVVVTFSLSVGLAVTFIGLPLLAASGAVVRWLTAGERAAARLALGVRVEDPPPLRARPGLLGWIGASLKDVTAWRGRAYLLLKLPVGIFTFAVTVAFWSYALGGATYWIWQRWLPCNGPDGGACHPGAQIGPHTWIDTPWRDFLALLVGVALLFIAPWVTRTVLGLDRALVPALLGPTASRRRVVELEQSRTLAVDDSAASLRRIERDLHDGTQARLVAVAMNLGLAKEKLAAGEDPAEVLDRAHRTAKDAIVELRDIARGIHPPALDDGLDQALATLAARSSVPVALTSSITERPSPSIATIAYFCAAELLANVAKHSGAGRTTLSARTDRGRLLLTVQDDGHGGAAVGRGSGLTGLADRVRVVDGALRVESPVGGPTTVSVELPVHA